MLVETGRKEPNPPKIPAAKVITASVVSKPLLNPGTSRHKVRSGESLYSISRRYHCNIAELRRLNGLKQQLDSSWRIPQGSCLQSGRSPPNACTGTGLSTFIEAGAKVVSSKSDPEQPHISVVNLDTLTSVLRIKGLKSNPQQERATLYGFLLENNSKPGVLYCSAGANGVTYYHYNRAENFADQAAMLFPDLIIITLGTNESFLPGSKMGEVEREITSFLKKLRTKMPNVPILVTINPDVLKNKSADNTIGLQVRDILRRQTQEQNVAIWDLHQIMGGLGSMRRWRSAGLAQADGIHFTEQGYLVKAQLLYSALMKAYAADNWTDLSGLWTYVPSRPLLFSNLEFFILFFIFYSFYLLLLRSFNLRLLLTTIFSLFFYYKCTGGPVNLWILYSYPFLLLIFSAVVDFFLGHFIFIAPSKGGKLLFLVLSLVFNLGMLVYFKYTNFFIEIANAAFDTKWALQNIYLRRVFLSLCFKPSVTALMYTGGKLEPVSAGMKDLRSFLRSFLDFGFFVTFFPQLLAGPIVRAADFLPQIRKKPSLSNAQMSRAMILIMGGLFKKAIISDYISVNYVDRIFENPNLYSGLENLTATYGYAIQIYCDFSGYSDMAIGLALLLGFALPDNFHTPYRSSSIQEFWRRWHISLSSWLRDYLYISLGGNRKGKFFTYINLMITMILGGLWHGASWVFIAWGALHGVALAIDRALSVKNRFWGNPAMRAFIIVLMVQLALQGVLQSMAASGSISPEEINTLTLSNLIFFSLALLLTLVATAVDVLSNRQILGTWVGTFLTFHFVAFCWILFRSGALNNPNSPLETTSMVLTQIGSSFHGELWGQLWDGYKPVLFLIVLGYVLHFLPERWYAFWDKRFERSPVPVKSLVLALVVWLVIQTASADVVPFIYFQF